jgi:hypothetical protein
MTSRSWRRSDLSQRFPASEAQTLTQESILAGGPQHPQLAWAFPTEIPVRVLRIGALIALILSTSPASVVFNTDSVFRRLDEREAMAIILMCSLLSTSMRSPAFQSNWKLCSSLRTQLHKVLARLNQNHNPICDSRC